MSVDYKKELESASKNMILIHEPDLLMKLIVRMMVHKINVTHAGILLYDKTKKSYILTISRGPLGSKIPVGFAKMEMNNPLIQFFATQKNRQLLDYDALVHDEAMALLNDNASAEDKELINTLLSQMAIFDAKACLPTYFRKELLGILLLGKKRDGTQFNRDEIDFFIALSSDVAMAIRNAQLFKELQIELENERRLFIHTTIALATAIDAKDHYTHGHTSRVTTYSLEIAKKFFEKEKKSLDPKFMEHVHIAALLHDIGKIGVPESILNKEGELTKPEIKIMQAHAVIGASILSPIKELGDALVGVKYHHERYDGMGYPEGLRGEKIPLIAAIISVADAFDAMTTDRPYRRHLPKARAVAEIGQLAGVQFHPKICSVLTELSREGKI